MYSYNVFLFTEYFFSLFLIQYNKMFYLGLPTYLIITFIINLAIPFIQYTICLYQFILYTICTFDVLSVGTVGVRRESFKKKTCSSEFYSLKFTPSFFPNSSNGCTRPLGYIYNTIYIVNENGFMRFEQIPMWFSLLDRFVLRQGFKHSFMNPIPVPR